MTSPQDVVFLLDVDLGLAPTGRDALASKEQ